MKDTSITHKCALNLSTEISIAIAGAGGTGCALAASLGRMSKTLMSLLPSYKMRIELYDPAPVRAANLGRQPYGTVDIGANKALALANVMNMAFPAECRANPGRYQRNAQHYSYQANRPDILVICVDSRGARHGILKELMKNGAGGSQPHYIIDCGNRKDHGQCVVGLTPMAGRIKAGDAAMPPPWDCITELYDPSQDNPSEPSCSAAAALASQDFNVNHFVAMVASEHIWKLITKGELETRGAFFNLRTMSCAPLKMDGRYRKRGKTITGNSYWGEYTLMLLNSGSVDYVRYETSKYGHFEAMMYKIVKGDILDPLTGCTLERDDSPIWKDIDKLLGKTERMAA